MSLTASVEAPPMALLIFIVVAAVACVGGGAAFGALYGVAGLVAVLVGLVLLRRPDIAAISMISLAPALSGLRRGLPVPGVRISEMLVVSAAVVVLLLGKHKRARWNAFDWLFLAYAVGNLAFNSIGAALHHIPFDSTAIGVLVGPFQFLLIFRVARTVFDTPKVRERAFRWIILASIPVSGLAVAQRFGGTPVVHLINAITDSDNFGANETYFTARVTGPFSHWHLLGGYLMVVTLLMVALMMEQHRIRVLPIQVMLPVMVLNLTAITLTLTIAIILGVIGAVVVLALMTGRAGRYLGYGAIGLTITGAAASPLFAGRLSDQFASNAANGGSPYVPQTMSYRINIWIHQYGPALHNHWVAGYGPAIPDSVTWKYTESLYITLLLRGGVPLLLIFLAFQGAMYSAARKQLKAPDAGQQAAARVIAAICIVLVPMQAIFPYFASVGLPHLVCGLAGLMLAGYRKPGLSDQVADAHEAGEPVWSEQDTAAFAAAASAAAGSPSGGRSAR